LKYFNNQLQIKIYKNYPKTLWKS